MTPIYRYSVIFAVGIILAGCTATTPTAPTQKTVPTPISNPASSPIADSKAASSPQLKMKKYPLKILAGMSDNFEWQVFVFLLPDNVENLPYTENSIWYDTVSHPGDFGVEVTPEAAGYSSVLNEYYATAWRQRAESSTEDLELVRTDKGDYATSSWNGDKDFIATLKADRLGTYYFRAHILFNGKHYWTPESQFEVVEKF